MASGPPSSLIATPTLAIAPVSAPASQPATQVVVIDDGSRGEAVIRVEDASRLAAIQPTPLATVAIAAPSPTASQWTSGDLPKSITPVTGPAAVSLASHNETSILVPSGSKQRTIVPTTITSSAPIASGDYESRYGRAPDYTRLKGKLEYSATRKQWKLRYIPVDAAGQTDQYGGSVLLAGVADMSQFHDGDFAAIEGTLGQRADDAKDYAASYQVRQIQRVQ